LCHQVAVHLIRWCIHHDVVINCEKLRSTNYEKKKKKKPIGRTRRRWEDNIKVDYQEVKCGVMDWIDLAQDRNRWRTLVNAVINLRFP
jgi:hypothetical protein